MLEQNVASSAAVAPRRARRARRQRDAQARNGCFPGEAIIGACRPIATAFSPSWMPFRTVRCRWPYLSFRSWVSRKSSMLTPRPGWIWRVWSRVTMSPWRKSAAGSAVIRRVVFRPAALRDLARLDRIVQARIDAALVRFAVTGRGDVKSLKAVPAKCACASASGASSSASSHRISFASSASTTGEKLTNLHRSPIL